MELEFELRKQSMAGEWLFVENQKKVDSLLSSLFTSFVLFFLKSIEKGYVLCLAGIRRAKLIIRLVGCVTSSYWNANKASPYFPHIVLVFLFIYLSSIYRLIFIVVVNLYVLRIIYHYLNSCFCFASLCWLNLAPVRMNKVIWNKCL